MEDLPWARPFRKRCRARLTRSSSEQSFWGRCELAPHSQSVLHALERGMVWVRWTDSPVSYTTPYHKMRLAELKN